MLKYILEFIAICDYLKKNQVKRKKGCFIVERLELETMLNRNMYETARDKLRTWKQLNWIQTDEDRLTKRLYQEGKYIAMIFINESVYLEFKRINGDGKGNKKDRSA